MVGPRSYNKSKIPTYFNFIRVFQFIVNQACSSRLCDLENNCVGDDTNISVNHAHVVAILLENGAIEKKGNTESTFFSWLRNI